MSTHRTSRARLSKQPTPDNRRTALPEPEPDELDHLTYTLRDNLRRADAFITTAERQIEENWHDDGDEEDSEEDCKMRHRMRIEYLVEGGKYAVRAALYTTQQIDAVLAAHRRCA
jgi:hypothetical protein